MKHAIPEETQLIHQVCNFFGLGEPDVIEPIAIGLANHNYVVSCDQQRFLVRFLVQQAAEKVENDQAIHIQLKTVGLDSPAYLVGESGSVVFTNGQYQVVAYPFIEGFSPKSGNEQLLPEIGRVLALFHQAVTTLPKQSAGWLEAPHTADVPSHTVLNSPTLPKGITHGDLHSYNVLVQAQAPTIITALLDFEEAGKGAFITDLGRTIMAECTTADEIRLDRPRIELFLSGYESIRPLTTEERNVLPEAIRHAGRCCIQWFTEHGYVKYIPAHQSRIESVDGCFSNS